MLKRKIARSVLAIFWRGYFGAYFLMSESITVRWACRSMVFLSVGYGRLLLNESKERAKRFWIVFILCACLGSICHFVTPSDERGIFEVRLCVLRSSLIVQYDNQLIATWLSLVAITTYCVRYFIFAAVRTFYKIRKHGRLRIDAFSFSSGRMFSLWKWCHMILNHIR